MRTGVVTPTVIVETALLREVGGFDETFTLSEDYDLWFRLAMRAEASAEAESMRERRGPRLGRRRSDRNRPPITGLSSTGSPNLCGGDPLGDKSLLRPGRI